MARYGTPVVFSLAVLGTLVLADGCAFNPFSTPDISQRPGATDASSSTGPGGTGGAGGSGVAGAGGIAGAGGLAGQGGIAGAGGAAGSGGAVCICDGVDDGNECTTDVMGECPVGDMAKCHKIVPGKPCSGGEGFVCSLAGKCDGDCLVCPNDPACTARCNGQVCPEDSGCKSGYCEQGVCCNAECIGPCRSCNREGTVGSCKQLPVGLQVPGCDTTVAAQGKVDACDNSGMCVTYTSAGWPLGANCGPPSDCISGRCKASGCASALDQPCIDDLECSSNRCDPVTHTCKPCSGVDAVQCRQGTTCFGAGTCTVLPGEPALSNTECAAGATVTRYLCGLAEGAMCKKHEECSSHHCKGGKCTAMCSGNGDCPMGFNCDAMWSQCTLPPGAYCIAGPNFANACQSGKCTGFPPRCE